MMLLHGSGWTGSNMINIFKEYAIKYKCVFPPFLFPVEAPGKLPVAVLVQKYNIDFNCTSSARPA